MPLLIATKVANVFPDTLTKTLNDATLAQAKSLSAEDRQMLVVTYVPKAKEVWLVKGQDGFVMLEDDNEVRLPLFPHVDLAQDWVNENGLDSECVAVALDEFTQTWLPGLAKNGVELVMFPTKSDEQNLVMSADDLAAELAS